MNCNIKVFIQNCIANCKNLSYGAVAYADKWNHYVRHIINFNNTSCDFSYTQKHFIIPALFVKGKLDHQLKKA
ncbi:hypothetical protein T01_632 [Trichinella spiralis]|uniref:Uncharacterized protein n=1 Tax=Trichinella spiralis TaxID=6334 RepID=A0A0V1BM85_TRISP|nr:hypothetical protein T01_632 [Trichinella spiralis]